MIPSVEDSCLSIFHSLSFLDSLPFKSSSPLVRAALATPSEFEGTYIREADAHELGIFQQTGEDGTVLPGKARPSNRANGQDTTHQPERVNRLRRSLLGRSANAYRPGSYDAPPTNRMFVQRAGPQRVAGPVTATPLRKQRQKVASTPSKTSKAEYDPEVYLIAAQKLLHHYADPTASERVHLLLSQYEGLVASIADLEEALRAPLQPPARAKTFKTDRQADSSVIEGELRQLEIEIKREELEVLALQEMIAEREKESRQAKSSTLELRKPADRTLLNATVKRPASKSVTSVDALKTSNPGGITNTQRRVPSAIAIAKAASKSALQASSAASTLKVADPVSEMESPVKSEEINTPDVRVSTEPAALPVEAKPKAKPVVQAPQLSSILDKIAQVLPAGHIDKIDDADAVLSALQTLSATTKLKAGDANEGPACIAEVSVSSPSNAAATSSTPVTVFEYRLLYIYLSQLLSIPLDESSSGLSLIMRDSSVPSATDATAPDGAAPGTAREGVLSMNALKTVLGDLAKARGWPDDVGTKAIYGLVAKRVLRIDRRGREAMVCFAV